MKPLDLVGFVLDWGVRRAEVPGEDLLAMPGLVFTVGFVTILGVRRTNALILGVGWTNAPVLGVRWTHAPGEYRMLLLLLILETSSVVYLEARKSVAPGTYGLLFLLGLLFMTVSLRFSFMVGRAAD